MTAHRVHRLVLTCVAVAVALAGVTIDPRPSPAGASGLCVGAPAPATYTHVVWIIMENRSYNQVVGHAPPLFDRWRAMNRVVVRR